MKILDKATMPDGTIIKIVDWSEDYSCFVFGDEIAAYPKNRYGKEFRASKHFDDAKKAKEAFNNLISGKKTLIDYNFVTKECGRDVPYQNKI